MDLIYTQQPIPTIRQILRTGTVGDLPLLPYSSMVASCFVWIVYGALKREPMIWGTNIVEFTLSLYFFVEFTNYAPKQSPTFPGSVYRHIQFVGGIWVASLFIALFFEENVSTVGDLTVLLTVLTFASPLAAVKAVLESQSSEAIPWPFTLAALLNCCLWAVVGLFGMHDIYVSLPALLGLVFALLQVALKLYFGDHHLNNQDNPSYMRAPVEMPYPVLGSVRQVVMLGNHYPNNSSNNNPFFGNILEDHDLQFDINMAGTSNADYVELGVPLTGGSASGVGVVGGGGIGDLHHLHHHHGPQPPIPPSTSSLDASELAFAQPPVPFHHHRLSKSNEGLESIIFDDNMNNIGVDESPDPPYPVPLQETFRSRSTSGSGGHPRGLGH